MTKNNTLIAKSKEAITGLFFEGNYYCNAMFIFGIVLFIICFLLKNQIQSLFLPLVLVSSVFIIPKLITDWNILYIFLLFVLFSNLYSVMGKILKLLLLLMLLVQFIYLIRGKLNGFIWTRTHLFISLFLLIILFSILFTINNDRIKKDIYELLRSILVFFISVEITILNFKHKKPFSPNFILNTLIISTVIIGLYSIFNILMNPIVLKYAMIRVTYRSTGWYEDPNYLALTFNTVLPISYIMLKSYKSKFIKFIYLISILIVIISTVLTLSRGGLIGLSIIILIIAYKERKSKITIFIFLLLLIGVFVLFNNQIIARLQTFASKGSTQDASLHHRLSLLKVAIRDIQHSPLFGIGFSDFKESASHYIILPMPTHNIWLHVFAETGLFGIVFFISIFISTIVMLNKTISAANKESYERKSPNYLTAIKYAQMGFLIPASFLSVHTYFLIWVFWGLSISFVWFYDNQVKGEIDARIPGNKYNKDS